MPTVDFASDPAVVWAVYSEVSGRRAFDIGANGGMVSCLLAERFDEVHAYEPAVESFDALCASTPDNVTPYLTAVSDVEGEVTLDVHRRSMGWGELITAGGPLDRVWGPMAGEPRQVRATTIDAEAARLGDPDFVKIDTEGHERRVLEGGLATIDRCDPRLMIEVHHQDHGAWILETLPGRFTRVAHPAYTPGSDLERSHYYLLRGVG